VKKTRWRKIIKVINPHAQRLMYTYFHHEHIFVTCGVNVLSEAKEIALLNTLQEYADTVERISKIDPYLTEKEWLKQLMDFQS
jgi:hypothetical protein